MEEKDIFKEENTDTSAAEQQPDPAAEEARESGAPETAGDAPDETPVQSEEQAETGATGDAWEPPENQVKERKLAGIVGALICALAGGALWILFSSWGIFVAVIGFACIMLALTGYKTFAGKQSKFGVISSLSVSFVVMLAAWYAALSWEVYIEYLEAFEQGETVMSPSIWEVCGFTYKIIPDVLGSSPAYFFPLVMAILLMIGGAAAAMSNVKKGY